jgi:hypothetical protein
MLHELFFCAVAAYGPGKGAAGVAKRSDMIRRVLRVLSLVFVLPVDAC